MCNKSSNFFLSDELRFEFRFFSVSLLFTDFSFAACSNIEFSSLSLLTECLNLLDSKKQRVERRVGGNEMMKQHSISCFFNQSNIVEIQTLPTYTLARRKFYQTFSRSIYENEAAKAGEISKMWMDWGENAEVKRKESALM